VGNFCGLCVNGVKGWYVFFHEIGGGCLYMGL